MDKTQLNVLRPALLAIVGAALLSGCANHFTSADDFVTSRTVDQPEVTYVSGETDNIHSVADRPISTFGLHVSGTTFNNARNLFNNQRLPEAKSIQLEEWVNYFSYDYPQPQRKLPFAMNSELAVTPWNPQTQLVRIVINASDQRSEERPTANLVVLVNVSNTLNHDNGLPAVKQTLNKLAEQLHSQDTLSLIAYAGQSQLILPPTSGDNKESILSAIEQLKTTDSLAGEDGLNLAYEQLNQHINANGTNRLIFVTDGNFSLGNESLEQLVAQLSQSTANGVSASVLSFNSRDYNDKQIRAVLEAGHGNYNLIDHASTQIKAVNDELAATHQLVAQTANAKIEFNPDFVKEYRLLGYEKRAGHSTENTNSYAGNAVTVLYEVVPNSSTGWLNSPNPAAAGSRLHKTPELAMVHFSFSYPGKNRATLVEMPVPASTVKPIDQVSNDFRFATAVAAFAQQLKGSAFVTGYSLNETKTLAQGALGQDKSGERAEFIRFIETAKEQLGQDE